MKKKAAISPVLVQFLKICLRSNVELLKQAENDREKQFSRIARKDECIRGFMIHCTKNSVSNWRKAMKTSHFRQKFADFSRKEEIIK